MDTRLRIVAAGLLVLVASCGDDGGNGSTAIASAEYARLRAQDTACGADRPAVAQQMSFDGPEELGLSGQPTAVLHTSCGDLTITLLADDAPITVNSFVFLAESGYFDGTASHRIYPGFVVQLGDPGATGHGNPGYRIADELPHAGFSYIAGVVAMANGGPDTGGSQFFITLADVSLDPNYTVFGFVSAGAEVLERIAAIPVTANPLTGEPSYPLETLYLDGITIQR